MRKEPKYKKGTLGHITLMNGGIVEKLFLKQRFFVLGCLVSFWQRWGRFILGAIDSKRGI
jgi:hypothetical protein